MSIKLPKYTKGRLSNGLSNKDVDSLIKISTLQKNKVYIDSLIPTIYSISKDDIAKLRKTKDIDSVSEISTGKLYDYQTLSVAFMLHSHSCLIGDSVGLGKTAEISSLINIKKGLAEKEGRNFRYLYVTEKSSVIETTNKLMSFTGSYVAELFGTASKVDKFINEYPIDEKFTGGICASHSIVKNSNFHSWLRESRKKLKTDKFFDLFIFDEAELLGNTSTDYYKYSAIIRDNAKDVILLNATPFGDNLKIMYNQLNFLDKELMPNYGDFARRFINFNPVTRKYDGSKGYARPDVFRHEISLKYFANTRRSLDAVFENCSVKIVESSLTQAQSKLRSDTSMHKMVYDCPQLLDSSIPFTSEFVSKLQSVDEILEENGLDNLDYIYEHPVIIYSLYKESHHYLKAYLEDYYGFRVGIINGDITSSKKRQEIIEDFREGEINVLITSVYRGIDLDVADTLIYYTFPSSPSKILQTEGRITRSLHVKDKKFFILLTKGKEKANFTNLGKKMKDNNEHTSSEMSLVGAVLTGEDFNVVEKNSNLKTTLEI